MTLTVQRLDQNLSNDAPPIHDPEITYLPDWYSHSALGGPDKAKVRANGRDLDLWELIRRLRAPYVITADRIGPVWWGYLAEIKVKIGAYSIGVSLDTMSNSVRVAYPLIAPGEALPGDRATTAVLTDAISIATYGTKERQIVIGGATTEAAELIRDDVLDSRRFPIPLISFGSSSVEVTAELTLLGWWHSLAWIMYSQPSGLESHEAASVSSTQAFGNGTSSSMIAQSFTLSSPAGWRAGTISARLRKTGVPADNVVAGLYTDIAGAPGTLLTSSTLTASAISDSVDWITFTLSPQVDLAISTTYWIRLSRTGGNDASNYYEADVDEGLGYTSGVFRIFSGSWVARGVDADQLFKVGGVLQTTQQLADLIAALPGQFFTGTRIINSSGVYTSQFRDGETTGLTEALDLLKTPSVTTGRRMLARVTRARILEVYDQPAQPDRPEDAPLWINVDGTFRTPYGPIESETCPVAQWAFLSDMIPPGVAFDRLADPRLQFIEKMKYSAKKHKLDPIPRAARNEWDVSTLDLAEG